MNSWRCQQEQRRRSERGARPSTWRDSEKRNNRAFSLLPARRTGGRRPVDLLCSRNARPEKDGMGSIVVLLLAVRARSEDARSTRALEDRPGCPVKNEAIKLGRDGEGAV